MAFWIVPLCLQPLIAIAIATRRQVRTFPLFFVYTLFVSTRDLALLFIKHNMRIYSWVYFLSEPLAIALGVAVIYEVSWHQIRSYSPLRSLGIRVFWATLGLALLAGTTMLKTSEFGQEKLWIESFFLLERSARFIQVEILIVFILFISHLGLTWKHYSAGIVAGFGIAAGLQLALYQLRPMKAIADADFYLLMSAAYNIAVLIWATYFLPPRRETQPPSELPKTDLPRWDEILRRYLNP